MLEALQTDLRRFKNFMGYAKNFINKTNFVQAIFGDLIQAIKEALTVKKKLMMAQYRLIYHRHQLNRMESLIAENNQHAFLRGKNLNETR